MSIKLVILIEPKSNIDVRLLGKRSSASCTLPVVAATIPGDRKVIIADENVQFIPYELMGPETLVGITSITNNYDRGCYIASIARNMGSLVVMGGIHVSSMPEDASHYADTVVIGEVEGLWPDILSDADAGHLSKTYQLPEPPQIESLPMPRWNLLNPDRYWNRLVTYTSRGCPHNCTFCTATKIFGRRVRCRSITDVVRDVRYMRANKVGTIFFADDNIASSKKRLRELCLALVPEKIRWMSQCHAQITSDPDSLELMAKSGCTCVLVGFESLALNPGVSRKMKGVKVAKAINAFHNHGIRVIGCFVCGLPGGTDYHRLARLINDMVDIPQITALTPFPGSADYEKALKAGVLLERPWRDFSATRVVSRLTESADGLRRDYDRLAREVYSPRQILRRTFRSLRRGGLYAGYHTLVGNLIYRGFTGNRDRPTPDQSTQLYIDHSAISPWE